MHSTRGWYDIYTGNQDSLCCNPPLAPPIPTHPPPPPLAGPVWRTGDLVEEDEYGCLQFREFLCANKYFHHGLKRADDPDRIATIPLAFLAWIEMLVSYKGQHAHPMLRPLLTRDPQTHVG